MHTNLLAADAAAVRATVALVSKITDWAAHTPCAGWDAEALVKHMTEQHLIFASAARGAQVPAVRTYAEAADLVLDAFAEPGVLDRDLRLPEIHPTAAFPAPQAIGFHLVDYVVHGWDVAATLGIAYSSPPDVLALTLPIARAVPDGPGRLAPGAAFAPARPVPPGTAPLDEILLLLGRDPAFRSG